MADKPEGCTCEGRLYACSMGFIQHDPACPSFGSLDYQPDAPRSAYLIVTDAEGVMRDAWTGAVVEVING